jgi:hypothetical protein
MNKEIVRTEPNPKNYMLIGNEREASLLLCDIYCHDESQDELFESIGIKPKNVQTALWMDGVIDLSCVQMIKITGHIVGCDLFNLTEVYFKSSIYDSVVAGVYFDEFLAVWSEWKIKQKGRGKL